MSEPESSPHSDPWDAVPRPQAEPPPQQQPPMPRYGYPPPGAYYGYPPMMQTKTNGLAIAALVCGICGFLYLVPAILGIVFGSISLRQIRRDGTEGRGMAIAGIAVGAAWLLLVVILILIVVAVSTQ